LCRSPHSRLAPRTQVLAWQESFDSEFHAGSVGCCYCAISHINLTKIQYQFGGQKGIHANCGLCSTFALTQLVSQPKWRRRGCGVWRECEKPLVFASILECRCICSRRGDEQSLKVLNVSSQNCEAGNKASVARGKIPVVGHGCGHTPRRPQATLLPHPWEDSKPTMYLTKDPVA
jgi:hypothetical protein